MRYFYLFNEERGYVSYDNNGILLFSQHEKYAKIYNNIVSRAISLMKYNLKGYNLTVKESEIKK